MKFLNFLRKSKSLTQSIDVSNCQSMYNNRARSQYYIDSLLYNKKYSLAYSIAIQYACLCPAVDNGIDRLATAAAAIIPLILNKKEDEFMSDHPLQLFLENPNFIDHSSDEFFYKYAAFYLITGDNFSVVNSMQLNSEPRQLLIVHPQIVTINEESNGIITNYQLNTGTDVVTYNGVPDVNFGMRYIATLKNGVVSELLHTRNFNPISSEYDIKGRSPLTSIYYEIEKYIASSTHNLSLLKHGTTLSGIFKHPDILADDQYQKLKSEIQDHYSGENNAGKPFVADGGLEFIPSQKQKDMDFETLEKTANEMMYKKFKIPLPIISAETMTMANLAAAKLDLYDEGVLPLVKRIYADLTFFLMHRYKNSENLKLWYDIGDIPALEPRRNEQILAKKQMGIYTINQLRAMDQADGISNGQNIFGQATEVPIATDEDDPFAKGTEDSQQQSLKPDKKIFVETLSHYTDSEGKSLFTQDEIDKASEANGL